MFKTYLVLSRDKAAVEQRHHSGCIHLALLCFLVRHAPHWLGRVRLRAPQDLLYSGLQQGRQVLHAHMCSTLRHRDKYGLLLDSLSLAISSVLQPCVFSLPCRNYVSYLIPMSIFNMAIQVFVVMSSYQSIAQKFKKTGNNKVSPVKKTINLD